MAQEEKVLKFFAEFIQSRLGIVYSQDNFFQLQARLQEICRNLDIPNLEKLYSDAKIHGITGHFEQMLLDLATNNETFFFRDMKLYTALEKVILPGLFEKFPERHRLRILSAACSSGQEPYSLAMMLVEMSKKKEIPPFEIIGADVSLRVLDKALEGKYSQLEVQRGLPVHYLSKYFRKDEEDYFYVNEEVKSCVSFQKLNLLDIKGVFGPFDIILCRNVLIYQTIDKKKEVTENFASFLAPDGYLILGASESLIEVTDQFNHTEENGMVYYHLK